MKNNNIDFVIMWVDGNDAEWKTEFNKYHSYQNDENSGNQRYRDWEILRYWFRSIEHYAPWVNRIHFVTCGHYPSWINEENSKIHLVKHEDYINRSYLPVFSANPIELNLHKIKGLSENFVFFNDDFFLSRKSVKTDFFKKNLPVDNAIISAQSGGGISTIIMNDLEVINANFSKYAVLKRHFFKFFNFKYGFELFRSLLLLPWTRFTGFFDPHQPQPYLKSTFYEVWQFAEDKLNETTANRFRTGDDCNQYLMRYWQLVTGNFHPYRTKNKMFNLLEDQMSEVEEAINSEKYLTLCLNDGNGTHEEFQERKAELITIFEKKFPNKSSFEI